MRIKYLGGDKEKMKTKIVVLVGIALCAMLLISPALASDAGTLEIYGNANEDDTIDMRDLTYVKLIFFGKKPETELADAKYDGKINPLDFIQIKLIIVGKEKELTIVDSKGKKVTVRKPIERVVARIVIAEAIKIVRVEDKMVGVTDEVKNREVIFPELSKLPLIGTPFKPDYEKIIELEPDIVIWAGPLGSELEDMLEPIGITVIRLSFGRTQVIIEDIKKFGYMFDKNEEANEFISWYNGYMSTIEQRTDKLSEEDKPKVYFASYLDDYKTMTRGYPPDPAISIAGGRNIAADIGYPDKFNINVEPEWVVRQNPDIIVKGSIKGSYEVDDPTELREAREAILNRPELAYVCAIKNRNVYVLSYTDLVVRPRCIVSTAYMAKWFHPELFEDLDPKAIHQEYLDRFMRIDYDLDEHGVFVYPPLED